MPWLGLLVSRWNLATQRGNIGFSLPYNPRWARVLPLLASRGLLSGYGVAESKGVRGFEKRFFVCSVPRVSLRRGCIMRARLVGRKTPVTLRQLRTYSVYRGVGNVLISSDRGIQWADRDLERGGRVIMYFV